MKLIIDISDNLYNVIKLDEYGLHKGKMYDIIRNGIPLDFVKAEIKENIATRESNKSMVQNVGLYLALEILDNIGKSERED